MGGYIGATAVGLTTTAADVQGDITSTDTTPELILKNTSEEDTEGGREGKITFKGEQSGGEETTLAQIESAHDGTSDDEKGDLIFKTNDGNDGAAPTERLRLDSAGDMLLSSPDPSFTITNTTHEDTDGGRESTIVFKGEQSGGELSTLAEIEASHDGTADDEKGDLIFRTNDGSDGASPTEAMRIDSSQNVGIGTSSPNGYANYNVLTIDGTSGGVLDLERNGTLTGEIYVGADQLLIDAVGSSSFLNFQTNSTERMRITSDGFLCVGTTTSASNGMVSVQFARGTTAGFRVQDSVGSGGTGVCMDFYNSSNTSVGSITHDSSGMRYNTTSDARLKENVKPIVNGTETLMAMKPVSYTWIDVPENGEQVGFIAQDMQKLVPEAVSGEDGGEEMMSMDYGRITPVLVAALQDAHKKIEALESRLKELEVD